MNGLIYSSRKRPSLIKKALSTRLNEKDFIVNKALNILQFVHIGPVSELKLFLRLLKTLKSLSISNNLNHFSPTVFPILFKPEY